MPQRSSAAEAHQQQRRVTQPGQDVGTRVDHRLQLGRHRRRDAARRFLATRVMPRNTLRTAARLHGLSSPSASCATLIYDSQRASVVGLCVVACSVR